MEIFRLYEKIIRLLLLRRNTRSLHRIQICDSNDVEIPRFSSPKIMDLPTDVFSNILLKFPVERILLCKRVCKIWRLLISEPEFVKLHFAQENTAIFIQDRGCFYLMERPQDELLNNPAEDENNSECQKGISRGRIIIDSKRKVPLFKTRIMVNGKDNDPDDDNPIVCISKGIKNMTDQDQKYKRVFSWCNDFVSLVAGRWNNYKIGNFCDGLLLVVGQSDNEPLAVCNPVLGEFTTLPRPWKLENNKDKAFGICGLGFSPKHNKYKVIRTFDRSTYSRDFRCHGEILTLGAGSSWKSVGFAPNTAGLISYNTTYTHGALHWLSSSSSITYFDFDNEKFDFHSLPPKDSSKPTSKLALGVLEGCLCLYDFSRSDLDVWVMKEYGVDESWTKLLSTDIFSHRFYGLHEYEPLSYLSNGTLLVLKSKYSNFLMTYNFDRLNLKIFKLHGSFWEFQTIAFTPSLISLKDIVTERM